MVDATKGDVEGADERGLIGEELRGAADRRLRGHCHGARQRDDDAT